jgi:hypothetical protein
VLAKLAWTSVHRCPHAKADANDTALLAFVVKARMAMAAATTRIRTNECRDKQNGKTYNEHQKQQNYDSTVTTTTKRSIPTAAINLLKLM